MSTHTSTESSAADNEVEYRSYTDDAWYSVHLVREGENLTVKFSNFDDDQDEVFEAGKFVSSEKLEDFHRRFRPLSVQLQDKDCSKVVEGLHVCASHATNDRDVRFYDAVVDNVIRQKHSFVGGEEECLCSFILLWQHGPHAETLMEKKVESICVVQSHVKLNPSVASFIKMARHKIEGAPSKLVSNSNGDVATSNGRACHKENVSPSVKQKSTFAQRLMQVRYFVYGGLELPNYSLIFASNLLERQSTPYMLICRVSVPNDPQLTFGHKKAGRTGDLCERNRQDTDVGGVDNHSAIFLQNLEKELSPSTIINFIRQQTGITPQVYVFPSLSYELYTQGTIVLDFKKDLEDLYDFLNNPDQIIISSRGRPWVVAKNCLQHDVLRASNGTFMLTSQKKLQNSNAGISHELRIVHSGTEEYRTAKKLKDLFMEFISHQERLYKSLAIEERKILQPSPAM